MTPTIWLLTYAANDYDQHGDYFMCAWGSKPSLGDLQRCFQEADERSDERAFALYEHILNGGGRRGIEDVWYYLTQYALGTVYEDRQ